MRDTNTIYSQNDYVSSTTQLEKHYSPTNLLKQLEMAILALGKNTQTVTMDDLAPMDEFHVGGREATQHLLDQLALSPQQKVLDIGCGLGGAARFTAMQYGSKVIGFDLTNEFISVGQEICQWMQMQDKVDLRLGNIMQLPIDDNSLDGVYMLHVGMNIKDKISLFKEIARVLKPEAQFAVYDLIRIGEGEINFPVPWSAMRETSFVDSIEVYLNGLAEAGLDVVVHHNRLTFALDFYQRLKTQLNSNTKTPIGLHLLMGQEAEQRLANAYAAVNAGIIAPFEIIALKS